MSLLLLWDPLGSFGIREGTRVLEGHSYFSLPVLEGKEQDGKEVGRLPILWVYPQPGDRDMEQMVNA